MRPINRVIEIVGTQEAVAAGVRERGHKLTQGAVSQWVQGDTAISTRYWPALCEMANGEVTAEDFMRDEAERLEARQQKSA